jgi:hypothetical protein
VLERQIEAKLGERLRAAGCLYWKFVSPGNDGVPDRIVVCPGGQVMFVELKADGGVLTPMQRQKIDQLREHGADVRVVKGLVGAQRFAEEVMPK